MLLPLGPHYDHPAPKSLWEWHPECESVNPAIVREANFHWLPHANPWHYMCRSDVLDRGATVPPIACLTLDHDLYLFRIFNVFLIIPLPRHSIIVPTRIRVDKVFILVRLVQRKIFLV